MDTVEPSQNQRTIVYALRALAGDIKAINNEDLAIKCYNLDKATWKWARYDYPDKARVEHALRTLRQNNYVGGGAGKGWS